MEVVRTVGSVMGSIKLVVDLIETSTRRGAELAAGLDCIKEDLDLIKARLVEYKELDGQPLMQLKLQELAYTIDDFVQHLWIPGRFGGILLSATGSDPRLVDTARIVGFKDRVKALLEELDKRSQWTKSDSSMTAPDVCSSSSSAGSPSYAPEKDLVGIAKAKQEIVDLLSPLDGSLRVISIAGRSGLGKTALARALYQDEAVMKKFDYKSWVVVPSNDSSPDILNKILQAIVPTSAHFSKDKRYLVFVDDVQRGTVLRDIKNPFNENVMDSRIIVTTSIPSVAMQCSSGSFFYTMQGLDKENSRELFCRKFRGEAGYSEEDKYRLGIKGVDLIVDKCDGLPIALISAAECLHGKNIIEPTRRNFMKVGQELGDNLACSERDFELFKKRNGNTTFVEMRRAIVEPYENLLNNGEKDCLLYGSIFPSGYQINSKSLVRLLIAEGLGPGDPQIMKDSEHVVSDVHECLRMLMDQRMIEPVPIRSNCNAAKNCRVHNVMLQFTLKKAVSRNFVSVYHNEKSLYNTAGSVRRLTIQSSADVGSTGPAEEMDLSVLRSLSIFERGNVNYKNCKLVRVLNLEGCCGLTLTDLDNICGLLFLKYLSLRKTDIQVLPENVKNLRCLETLDTRDTVVIKLPVEVIMLPQFAYLFGKFELTNVHQKNTKKLTNFFSKKRRPLHTLGEISVDKPQDLDIVLLVIQLARELKKVKVWCKKVMSGKRTAPDNGGPLWKFARHDHDTVNRSNQSVPATQHVGPSTTTATSSRMAKNMEERCMNLHPVPRLAETLKENSMRLESVSVDFNGVSNTFLDFLQINGTISSIKLQKGFGSLPGPEKLGKVCNLKKLHLFSTGLESDKLEALQHLKCLQYLKLAEEGDGLWDTQFHVKVGGFISLIWLCFEASNSKPPPLKIDGGVKTPLNSLLLLCKECHPRVAGISHLAKLNEVILHSSATDDEVTLWREEAEKHINRPYVEKQQV